MSDWVKQSRAAQRAIYQWLIAQLQHFGAGEAVVFEGDAEFNRQKCTGYTGRRMRLWRPMQ